MRTRKKAPVLLHELRSMVGALPHQQGAPGRLSFLGLRDRLILTLGWAAALRRSELAALDVADVREVPEGLEVTIRASKTNQEGAEELIGVPAARPENADLCPAAAYREFLAATEQDPQFLEQRRAAQQLLARLADRARDQRR